MMHRPCGLLNPTAPCMAKGVCTKRYPKSYRLETSLSADGYPDYRRRNDGRFVMCRGVALDNRNVVPYSPYLTRMFQAHINVELCALIHVIKYVYKYVYNGSDRAKLRIDQSTSADPTHDDILAYLDTRYVCAPEAIHRVFGFPMQERSVAVQRLQVHLPGFENVTFQAGAEQSALNVALTRQSTLTAFFAINANSSAIARDQGRLPHGMQDSRQYHYYEMPEHFVFQNGWKQRQRSSSTIRRMYFVGPHEVERFALRLLLLYGKGFTSFADVRTVDATEYPSFASAARDSGFLRDDTFFEQSLREAASFRMPAQLRSYFVSLIMFGELHPPLPESLWDISKNDFMDDFLRSGHTPVSAESHALHDIMQRISSFGKEWSAYFPTTSAPEIKDVSVVDREHHRRTGDSMYALLNTGQKRVVDAVLSALENSRPHCFFVDGPGGSGKTFVYTTIYHMATARHFVVLNVAWTGIAANLLPNGRTATSAFRLIVAEQVRASSMTRLSKEALLLKNTDKSSGTKLRWRQNKRSTLWSLYYGTSRKPAHRLVVRLCYLGATFAKCYQSSKKAAVVIWCLPASSTRFHGLIIRRLLSQLTCVLMAVTPNSCTGSCKWVMVNSPSAAPMSYQYPPILFSCNIVDAIFSDAFAGLNSDLSTIVILTPRNADALLISETVLDRLRGEKRTFLSEDEAAAEVHSDAFNFPTEFINKMTPTGLPPHKLHLKIGCIVMLLRNLDVLHGLCNGSRFIVMHIGQRALISEHAAGCYKGTQVLIPRIDCYYTNQLLPFRLRRRQIPVRLSFAMTINKSQGQSFTRVGIALKNPIFSHGQLYVAFSRARTRSGVVVEAPANVMHNIVYAEVLR